MPRAKPEKAKPKLIEALSKGLIVEEACKIAGCSVAAFYKWQKEDVEFVEALTRAREAFALNVDEDIQVAANARLLDLLVNGFTQTVVTQKRVRNPETGRMITVAEEIQTTNGPTPKWVYDKLMPESLVDKMGGMIVQFNQQANNQFNAAP